jgi:hypothetical protein
MLAQIQNMNPDLAEAAVTAGKREYTILPTDTLEFKPEATASVRHRGFIDSSQIQRSEANSWPSRSFILQHQFAPKRAVTRAMSQGLLAHFQRNPEGRGRLVVFPSGGRMGSCRT